MSMRRDPTELDGRDLLEEIAASLADIILKLPEVAIGKIIRVNVHDYRVLDDSHGEVSFKHVFFPRDRKTATIRIDPGERFHVGSKVFAVDWDLTNSSAQFQALSGTELTREFFPLALDGRLTAALERKVGPGESRTASEK
jgi:hypothetical protein